MTDEEVEEEENYVYVPRKKRAEAARRTERVKRGFSWRRFLIKTSIAAGLLAIIAVIVLNAVTPVIIATAEARIKALSTKAVNDAVLEVMTYSVRYGDLVTVVKDDAGRIQLIQANSILINRLAQDTAKASEEYIAKIGEQGIAIPIGTMSGFAVFSGKGPEVNIKVIPSGNVVCEFMSEFEEAGINQTRHKIFLQVKSCVIVVLPNNKIDIYNTTQVLVAENIIIGEVPSAFFKVSPLGGSPYNLNPS